MSSLVRKPPSLHDQCAVCPVDGKAFVDSATELTHLSGCTSRYCAVKLSSCRAKQCTCHRPNVQRCSRAARCASCILSCQRICRTFGRVLVIVIASVLPVILEAPLARIRSLRILPMFQCKVKNELPNLKSTQELIKRGSLEVVIAGCYPSSTSQLKKTCIALVSIERGGRCIKSAWRSRLHPTSPHAVCGP